VNKKSGIFGDWMQSTRQDNFLWELSLYTYIIHIYAFILWVLRSRKIHFQHKYFVTYDPVGLTHFSVTPFIHIWFGNIINTYGIFLSTLTQWHKFIITAYVVYKPFLSSNNITTYYVNKNYIKFNVNSIITLKFICVI